MINICSLFKGEALGKEETENLEAARSNHLHYHLTKVVQSPIADDISLSENLTDLQSELTQRFTLFTALGRRTNYVLLQFLSRTYFFQRLQLTQSR